MCSMEDSRRKCNKVSKRNAGKTVAEIIYNMNTK